MELIICIDDLHWYRCRWYKNEESHGGWATKVNAFTYGGFGILFLITQLMRTGAALPLHAMAAWQLLHPRACCPCTSCDSLCGHCVHLRTIHVMSIFSIRRSCHQIELWYLQARSTGGRLQQAGTPLRQCCGACCARRSPSSSSSPSASC